MPRNSDKYVLADREGLRQAFARAAILSNDKLRGVRLNLQNNLLRITANNPEQEEAEELLDVSYSAPEMEIGFNVSYVLDVLNTLKCDQIKISLTDANSSALLEDASSDAALYVVMPMRL
jgi:DNA polymerase-3 subunit beta